MKVGVLDIGGTAIKAGVYEEGVFKKLQEHPTNAQKGGLHVVKSAIAILKELGKVDTIGISTAGQVDAKQGIIKYANSNIPGYTGMKLKEILETEFSVPVMVENDVNAAAIGEAYFGAGKTHQNFLCLTYGTGVGGAIFINGSIYRGSSFSAGEMGAMLVHPEDRISGEDKYSGCYEKYASTTALVKKALELDDTLTDGKTIFSRISEKEVEAIVDNWVAEVVVGLTSLIHIFNPSCVVLGGGVMKQDIVLEKIKKRIDKEIMESYQEIQILQAKLGNHAGLYGAAYCAIKGTEE